MSFVTNDTTIQQLSFTDSFHFLTKREQPMSDRTLGRFRQRCATYEEETGIDLLHDTITSLSGEMAALMQVDHSLKRMDSFMVASNIKKMSRLELLYTCVANLVKTAQKREMKILAELSHYLKKEDMNEVIYHSRSEDTLSRVETVPSVLRRKYDLDHMLVRGKIRTRWHQDL